MAPSTEPVIPLSKTKILLAMIGSIAFVGVGAWMFGMSDVTAVHSLHRPPLYVHGVGLVSMIFAGLCGIIAARKFFDRRPGLHLTEAGLIDNSSGVSAGFVPWTDIIGIKLHKIAHTRFLVVEVAEPEKYIARGSAVRRWLNRKNFHRCGSPITISSTALAIDFDDLTRLFNHYLSKYRAAPFRGQAATRT
ncbi:MAG TPA: STM3941 family protein [Aliidongia sp.]|nr:STM3941 family protein [Aliidongia sp.]